MWTEQGEIISKKIVEEARNWHSSCPLPTNRNSIEGTWTNELWTQFFRRRILCTQATKCEERREDRKRMFVMWGSSNIILESQFFFRHVFNPLSRRYRSAWNVIRRFRDSSEKTALFNVIALNKWVSTQWPMNQCSKLEYLESTLARYVSPVLPQRERLMTSGSCLD